MYESYIYPTFILRLSFVHPTIFTLKGMI